jgi:hypothetical protein
MIAVLPVGSEKASEAFKGLAARRQKVGERHGRMAFNDGYGKDRT